MWTATGAIAGVLGIIPLTWKMRDLFGGDVVVDRISDSEVVLTNRSKHAPARNVLLKIGGRGDTEFELGDDPDRLDHGSIKLKSNLGGIPPKGEMRIDVEACKPNFDWLPAQVEVKTMWSDSLSSWLPEQTYTPSNKRRFNRDKFY